MTIIANLDLENLRSVDDEITLLFENVNLNNAKILDIGCGNGAISKLILKGSRATSVTGVECDIRQLNKAQDNNTEENLYIKNGEAQNLSFPDASFDVVTMFKSLHHVPVDSMDDAMFEIARVLKKQGVLFVLEPAYHGEFNDLVKLFHDEGYVRSKAIEAIARTQQKNTFKLIFSDAATVSISFSSFDDFKNKIMLASFNSLEIDDSLYNEIKTKFERYLGENGA